MFKRRLPYRAFKIGKADFAKGMLIEKLSNRKVKKAVRLFVDIYMNRSIMGLTARHYSVTRLRG